MCLYFFMCFWQPLHGHLKVASCSFMHLLRWLLNFLPSSPLYWQFSHLQVLSRWAWCFPCLKWLKASVTGTDSLHSFHLHWKTSRCVSMCCTSSRYVSKTTLQGFHWQVNSSGTQFSGWFGINQSPRHPSGPPLLSSPNPVPLGGCIVKATGGL